MNYPLYFDIPFARTTSSPMRLFDYIYNSSLSVTTKTFLNLVTIANLFSHFNQYIIKCVWVYKKYETRIMPSLRPWSPPLHRWTRPCCSSCSRQSRSLVYCCSNATNLIHQLLRACKENNSVTISRHSDEWGF